MGPIDTVVLALVRWRLRRPRSHIAMGLCRTIGEFVARETQNLDVQERERFLGAALADFNNETESPGLIQ